MPSQYFENVLVRNPPCYLGMPAKILLLEALENGAGAITFESS